MSYETHTWESGETITAEKLNHIEDGIAECCSGGDVGYECVESTITLTEESVTVASFDGINQGQFAYSQPIVADVIRVTFNGTQYECERIDLADDSRGYGGIQEGGPDFSEYPFVIISSSVYGGNKIYTETVGIYSVKIEAVESSVETSECFQEAVESVVGFHCGEEYALLTAENITTLKAPLGDNSSAILQYDSLIAQDEIKVIWDGVEYICTHESIENDVEYGAYGAPDVDGSFDWSEYPFALRSFERPAAIGGRVINLINTQVAGTYAIEIQVLEPSVETVSPCFEKAVKSVVSESPVLQLVPDVTTKAEAIEAFNKGMMMYFINTEQSPNRYEFITSFSPDTGSMGSTPATDIIGIGFSEEDTFYYSTR